MPPTLQTADASGTTPGGSLRGTINAIERELIQDALKWAKGNLARAARSLQISERIMGLRVHKYGIDSTTYKS
ncbi:Nitrogen fixation protein AnfA [Geodia barretti]|uniref:Nitrogen fixation protein AnfA n=1 Tax=Geodia barretti TaxID=519541 RepID=A0AA35RBI0_GEOBA|nr:Nitrogen fixation protein AnfA [Geodia barretti]